MSMQLTRDAQSAGFARLNSLTLLRAVLAVALLVVCSGVAMATPPPVIIYNNVPGPLPPNVASEPFQADHTSEFGELIQFAGTNRVLSKVNVLMSDHTQAADYTGANSANCPVSSSCTAAGWSHPITLNLYNVNNGGPNPAPGTLIATITRTFAIPWRPNDNPMCPPGRWLNAADMTCYSGLAFPITFDLSAMGITLPNQIIYGVAYNTPANNSGSSSANTIGAGQIPTLSPLALLLLAAALTLIAAMKVRA